MKQAQPALDGRIELYRYARTPAGILKETSIFLPSTAEDRRSRELPQLKGRWLFFSVNNPLSDFLSVIRQQKPVPPDNAYWLGPFSGITLKPGYILITEEEFEKTLADQNKGR